MADSRLNQPTYSIIEEVLDLPGNNIFAKVATPNLAASPKLFNLNGKPVKVKDHKEKAAPKKSYFKQLDEEQEMQRVVHK